MRNVWFAVLGFSVGAVAVFFIVNPAYLNPYTLWDAITRFFSDLVAMRSPQAGLALTGIILLVMAAGAVGGMAYWVTILKSRLRELEDEVYELRSQIAELLKIRGAGKP